MARSDRIAFYLRPQMGAHAVSLGDRLLRPRRVRKFVERLADGQATTVYVASYPRRTTRVRLVALEPPQPLRAWARRSGVSEALSAGFATEGVTPLGELWVDGVAHMNVPVDDTWADRRSCVHVEAGEAEVAPRGALPARIRGDLVQAGPLLVANGRPLVSARDPQGFAACAHQFECDITDGRQPRAALGTARDRYLAVVCDGSSLRDAGLSLGELSELMADLGAETAINLAGGASATLISGGALHNRPRERDGVALLGGGALTSAIVFDR